ncbi:MAG: hypothetical protein C0421_08770 [Hyphomonas sp.]|nr:hypothetical protein [Hyphomonas sp.]
MKPPQDRRSAWHAVLALAASGQFPYLVRKLLAKQKRHAANLRPKSRPNGTRPVRAPRAKPMIWMGGPSLVRDGAPLSQSELALGLAQRGFDIRVIAANDGPLRSTYAAAGIPVDLVAALQTSPSVPVWYEADVSLLADHIRQGAPDLVLASTIDTFALVDAARVAGVKTIWNIRESEPWRDRLSDRHPHIAARALASLAYAERLIFVAEASVDVWGAFTSRDRVIKIYNAVAPSIAEAAPSERAHIRATLGVAESEMLIASIGTLCRRKGQLDLADALNLLGAETLDQLRVLIVGREIDDYADRVRHRLSPAALARCNFMGERADATSLLAAADVLVNTSVSEAFPRTFLEAAASKTAIIATDVDGARERLRHNHSARLFPAGDAHALSAELSYLLSDHVARKALTRGAFDDLVANWTQGDMLSAYERVIRDALQRRETTT